ncbi:N-6 DNA methylase [Streptomyces niveiscabiei]|uniref:N-6 DNA methylase n=1 Tax=Streptomyces niveiscabiei TaxID=164115 RepID=UPI0029BEB30B|nr:N-6 DNA methylase [Streptomyces niveiscabiei]MDX3384475.1 N-6 DNA methylase [Streptomyces niveiscabiei]
MPQPPAAQVTAAEISRLAGVTRATVSNWRRRHDDFPSPAGGTESSPLYDLGSVQAWLTSRGHTATANPKEEFRTALRLHAGDGAALLPVILVASRRTPEDLTTLMDLTDTDLAARMTAETADRATLRPADGAALRALLRCVRDEGGRAALGILAERELEDSAASGVYRTPAPLAELVARLLPQGVRRVLDPACGSGTLLEAAGRCGATGLYGQDVLPLQVQRSTVALRLEDTGAEITVRGGDSLRTDAFPGLLVDAVLCNPPYGDRDWGHDELAYDPRWAYGVPARGESELAWIQHALAHLAPGGWAVLILPPATATRAAGRRIRAELVRGGAVRAVIALPAGAAPPLHVGLQIWVLQRPEPGGAERKSVLFVDSEGVGSGLGSGEKTVAHWKAFLTSPDTFSGESGAARAVPVVDLLDDIVDLTPVRRVRVSRTDVAPAELAAKAEAGRRSLTETAASLVRGVGLTEWVAMGTSAREWRTATASDLARGGALTLLRAVPGARERRADTAPRLAAVLTGADIAAGTAPSGDPAEVGSENTPVVAMGDVLVRSVAGGTGPMARVADESDAGSLLGPNVHLLRPDQTRLDPWFLVGFLDSEDNIAGASTGSTVLHVAPGRLRIPLMPLEEQRRYGEAFRSLYTLRADARRTARLAEETAELLARGLTGGALLPPVSLDQGSPGVDTS